MNGQALAEPAEAVGGDDGPEATAQTPTAVGGRADRPLWRAIEQPAGLLAGMLAVNGVFQPYRGRHHDSILYGFQLTNRATGGRHAEDLFLRFGSQDDYSLYSTIGAPLVRLVGVEAASLLMYAASIVLFCWAAGRLVRAIVPDRRIAAVALLAIAVAAVPLGGRGTFHVNENFMTPRLPSVGLALIGLERLMAGRWGASLAAMATSMAMHPLMGLGGAAVVLAWAAGRWVPPMLLAMGAVAGAAAVAVVPGLGAALFGEMDPSWYGEVLLRNRYMVGTEWEAGDWLRVASCFAVLLAARWLSGLDPRAVRLLDAVAVAATAGALGAALAGSRPIALLLAGQPFRVLWPIELLRLPLGFLLSARCWATGTPIARGGAVLLFGALTIDEPEAAELAAMLGVSAVSALALRGLQRRPRWPGWAWQAAMIGVAATSALRLATMHLYLAPIWDDLAALVDLDHLIDSALTPLTPAVRLGLGMAMLAALARLSGPGRGFRVAASAGFLGMLAVGEATSEDRFVGPRAGDREATIRRVARHLEARPRGDGRPPTVYWPAHLNEVWYDLGADSYFDHYQAAGIAFRRETAAEARRRIGLVAPFEQFETTNRKLILDDEQIAEFEQYYRPPGPESPRLGDLVRLCDDPAADVVVLRQGFPGWYADGDGRWFIYDCESVRARAAALGPGVGGPSACVDGDDGGRGRGRGD